MDIRLSNGRDPSDQNADDRMLHDRSPDMASRSGHQVGREAIFRRVKIFATIAVLLIAGCSASAETSTSTPAGQRTTSVVPTSSSAPTSSSIAPSPLTDATGRWTIDYARLRYSPLRDAYLEGQNIPLYRNSPFSVWHHKVTLESTGCTKYVEGLRSGRWPLRVQRAIDHTIAVTSPYCRDFYAASFGRSIAEIEAIDARHPHRGETPGMAMYDLDFVLQS